MRNKLMSCFALANLLTLIFSPVYFYSCGDSGVILPPYVPSWIRSYGSGASEIGTSASLTSDGGVVVCGSIFQSGSNDIFITKLDLNGNVIWTKILVAGGDDWATSIFPANDGGYVIAGQTSSFGASGFDICVIKINSAGGRDWSNFYRGPGNDYALSVQQNQNADFIVAGTSYDAGNIQSDIVLIKIDINGNVYSGWPKIIASFGIFNDLATCLRVTPNASDGGFIVGGVTFFSGFGDILIFKVADDGNITWANTYGGDDFDKVNNINVSSNGYILSGATKSFGIGPDEDALVMNINPFGNYFDTLSVRTFGFDNIDDEATFAQQSGDLGFYITGYMNTNIFLMKLYGDMVFNWEKFYGGSSDDRAYYLKLRNDGSILLAGDILQGNVGDLFLLTMNSDGTACSYGDPIIPSAGNPAFSMPPNFVNLSISIVSYPSNNAPFTFQDYVIPVNTTCSN